MCILAVPYKWAGAEPEGYNLSYSISLKKIFCFNLRKKRCSEIIPKPDKGNGVVILDRKLCNNAIEDMISDTSKFEKLNEDATLKREASLKIN